MYNIHAQSAFMYTGNCIKEGSDLMMNGHWWLVHDHEALDLHAVQHRGSA